MMKQIFSGLITGVVLGFVLIGLLGCATASLPNTATAEQKQAAYCADARTALATADAMLATVQPASDAFRYWTAFRAGAQVAITNYCPAPVAK